MDHRVRHTPPRAALLLIFCLCWLRPATAFGAELIVSAAASLGGAFKEMASEFERTSPDTRVVVNLGASGSLLQQMIHGAPIDVFASADEHFMARAAKQGLIDGATRRNFAGNRMVLAVPAGRRPAIGSVRDLAGEAAASIGIGNPASVPAGRYAMAILEKEGLVDRLRGKFIYAGSASQLLDYLKRGEIDSGIVYASDAHRAAGILVVAELAAPAPITYPIAVANRTSAPEAAARFVGFVLSARGQAILADHGFTPPQKED